MNRSVPTSRCARCAWRLLAAACLAAHAGAAEVTPLRQAHAHNDYEHARPLLDALDQGFTSVEADVFLVDGALLVAHEPSQVKAERTLQSLYLSPLAERVRAHGGSVYARPAPFLLLIDLKTEAEATYRAVDKALADYPELCTRWTETGRIAGPVTVVISGNRPIETLARQLPRQAAIDGRLPDLESAPDADLMPLISDRWGAHFTWRGDGEMPADERERLRRLVNQTHERGQLLRFWGAADTPAMWGELQSAGVDLINTDDLEGLSRFLRSR